MSRSHIFDSSDRNHYTCEEYRASALDDQGSLVGESNGEQIPIKRTVGVEKRNSMASKSLFVQSTDHA